MTDEHFATEFHGLEMSVGVVDDLDTALEHIRRYGSGHTEAIVTEDRAAARRFTAGGRGRGHGQRQHALHRRWRVRLRAEIGISAEAARPWPDGAPGAHDDQVGRRGRRSGEGLRARSPLGRSASASPSSESCAMKPAAPGCRVRPSHVLEDAQGQQLRRSDGRHDHHGRGPAGQRVAEQHLHERVDQHPGAAMPPSSPSQVAKRRDEEKPVTPSRDNRIILPSGYFDSPAARTARV